MLRPLLAIGRKPTPAVLGAQFAPDYLTSCRTSEAVPERAKARYSKDLLQVHGHCRRPERRSDFANDRSAYVDLNLPAEGSLQLR